MRGAGDRPATCPRATLTRTKAHSRRSFPSSSSSSSHVTRTRPPARQAGAGRGAAQTAPPAGCSPVSFQPVQRGHRRGRERVLPRAGVSWRRMQGTRSADGVRCPRHRTPGRAGPRRGPVGEGWPSLGGSTLSAAGTT